MLAIKVVRQVMRIFFSVGEPSGDLHGSNPIQELKRHDPDNECVGLVARVCKWAAALI